MQNLRARDLTPSLGLRTKLALAALGVLSTLVFLACAQDPVVKKQQHFDRGSRHLEQGKYNEAVIELKNALQLDPNFVPASPPSAAHTTPRVGTSTRPGS